MKFQVHYTADEEAAWALRRARAGDFVAVHDWEVVEKVVQELRAAGEEATFYRINDDGSRTEWDLDTMVAFLELRLEFRRAYVVGPSHERKEFSGEVNFLKLE